MEDRNLKFHETHPEYVCTMGPSIFGTEKLLELYHLGLRTIRFNMSHIDYDMNEVLAMIHKVEEITGEKIETMLDTCGTEARVRIHSTKDVHIGDEMVLGKDFAIDVPCESFLDIGDIIQIDDGKIELKVTCLKPLMFIALTNGKLKNGSGVYSQKISSMLPFMSSKDKDAFNLAFSKDLDWVACSFVKSAKDIFEIRNIQKKYPNCHTKIMAKIETREAIENLDEIIGASDGVMIARGDLAVAFPIHLIAALQDYVAQSVIEASIPLVIGTGFLRSMKKSAIPERAEVVDLYHAFHITNQIMFSGETAIADNPAHILITANEIFESMNHQEYVKRKTDF